MAVGFEPTPFRNGALSHRLRLLGQTVLERGTSNKEKTCAKHSVSDGVKFREFFCEEMKRRKYAKKIPMSD